MCIEYIKVTFKIKQHSTKHDYNVRNQHILLRNDEIT